MSKNCLLYPSTWVHPFFSWFVLLVLLIFCVVCFCVICLRSVCPVFLMLPMSLDCPFLIAPSLCSNVYLQEFMLSDRFFFMCKHFFIVFFFFVASSNEIQRKTICKLKWNYFFYIMVHWWRFINTDFVGHKVS